MEKSYITLGKIKSPRNILTDSCRFDSSYNINAIKTDYPESYIAICIYRVTDPVNRLNMLLISIDDLIQNFESVVLKLNKYVDTNV
ncbi:MAG TPA: hypothetical protein V6C58_14400, partial [Allocoleopsis sp.]